jgi:hypothetical protein
MQKMIKSMIAASMLSLFAFGCNTDKQATNDVTEDVTTVDDELTENEELVEETEELEPEFTLEPTHVFFYTTAIIKEDGSLDCYDTDDGPYCGVFRYYLADTENWTGLDDYTNVCHIVHALSPDHILANNDPTPFIESGDWFGWTMDASETYYGKSDSCSDIANDHKTKILVGQFANQDYSFGFGPATEDQLESFKEYIDELIEAGNEIPDWDTYWAPNIISNSIIAGGSTELTRPNYGFAFSLSEDGTPTTLDGKLLFIEMQNATGLVHGYYRSKTWWGYSIDEYIPESNE